MLSTVAGTVSHEFGHYAIAKYLGYSLTIGYDHTHWDDSKNQPFIDSVFLKHPDELEVNHDFPKKSKFQEIQNKKMQDAFWITLAGPIQTISTGTVGFLLLLTQRKKIKKAKTIKIYQWFYIFLSLFWLRQLANVFLWTIGYFINGNLSENGDEVKLAIFLNLPKESIIVSTAIVALPVLSFVIFKIIPADKRITFISAGFFGGIFGYLSWLVWFGPIIMP